MQGQGTVASAPAGIDCGSACAARFLDGARVVLSAQAATGWALSGWSGACSGATCTLTLLADADVTATFTQLPPPPGPLSISPATATLQPGATQRFTATAAVTWSAPDCGSITASGLFTAPASAGTCRVVATGALQSASAVVTVAAPPPPPPPPAVTVSISPSFLAIPANSNRRFSATVTGASDTSVTWSAPDGGTVDSTGLFTTPLASGRFRVVATSNADPTASAAATVRSDTPLVDNGGQVLPSVAVYAIWWGSQFGDSPQQIQSFFEGLNGSAYLRTLDQYMRGAKAQVSYAATLFDTSEPPTVSPTVGQTADEICNVLDAHGLAPRGDAYYAVFLDNSPINAPGGGWHFENSCHGVRIFIAVHINGFDGWTNQPADACGRSQTLGMYGSVAAHELAESMTDPAPGAGWTDPLDFSAPEIADRCPLPVFTCNVTLANGVAWRLEPLWSNAATECVYGTP